MTQLMIPDSRERCVTEGEPHEIGRLSRAPRIEMSAWQHFQTSQHHELRQLRCEFRDGTLSIYGHVSSYYLKQLAQELVRQIAGVDRIHNQLEVDYHSVNQR